MTSPTEARAKDVRRSIEVPASPAFAFAAFVHLDRWWPSEYTWSGHALVLIGMEPREGGFCYELGPNGFRCDWGRVVTWRPASALSFTWQIGPDRTPVPDPDRASLVQLTFANRRSSNGGVRARVDLRHDGFERYGEGGDAYATQLGGPGGWSYLLSRFRAAF